MVCSSGRVRRRRSASTGRRGGPRAGSAYACRSGTNWLELGADLRVGRLGIPLQQGLGPHHHAGDAIAALRRLLLDEGALDRRRRLDRAKAFKGGDLACPPAAPAA